MRLLNFHFVICVLFGEGLGRRRLSTRSIVMLRLTIHSSVRKRQRDARYYWVGLKVRLLNSRLDRHFRPIRVIDLVHVLTIHEYSRSRLYACV